MKHHLLLILFVGFYQLSTGQVVKHESVILGNNTQTPPSFSSTWISPTSNTDNPGIFFERPTQSSDRRLWSLAVISDEFRVMSQKDDFSQIKNAFVIKRGSNINIDHVSFPEGKVGIGTNAPNSKLDIYSSHSQLRLTDSDDGNYVSMSYSSDMLAFRNNVDDGSIPALSIHDNGKVGIGTNAPKSKLEVGVPHSGNAKEEIRIGSYWQSRFVGIGFQYSLTSSGAPRKHIVEHHDGAEYKSITLSKGNVGVGTISPGTWKLAVNGKIRAKEIKVETNWSDFVFYDNYKLPTLREVEEHIKEKGHLKDIPSEKEVKENGIFLGEMDAKLLQKIEELTLYTIQQQKEIEELKDKNKELNTLNSELTKLKSRLDQLENK